MDLSIGPEVVGSYKRLAYKPWYALAEFVDNSTQAYINNKALLDDAYSRTGTGLKVSITYTRNTMDPKKSNLLIEDNSIGMSDDELENAIIIGKPPANTSGRSKYGLGLKTAASWFGNYWILTTKKIGETEEHTIKFDVDKIIKGDKDLHHECVKNLPEESHYTKIHIWDLNQNLYPKTLSKVKNYLRSMYRLDISKNRLNLVLQNESLAWNYQDELWGKLLLNTENGPYKKDFTFEIKGKVVKGWAGVFEKGSRANAGFSIIQSERVITGWPNSFRPETLFGAQEGGSNDLVNQRLVGELYLDNFDVSHTKDEILFTEDEREELEALLEENLADMREYAKSYRKYSADQRKLDAAYTDQAFNEFNRELESNEIKDMLFVEEVPDDEYIKLINMTLKNAILEANSPILSVKINSLEVSIYLVMDLSPNDPYVIIESTENANRVIVIINGKHPYWMSLKSPETMLDFIRHCAYDGVAEWKAYFKANNIRPNTIKQIKDNLLRLPFIIENNL